MTEKPKKPMSRPGSCEEFLSCLDGNVSEPDAKSRLPKLLRLISQGFGPDPLYRPKPEEVERIEKRLMGAFDPVDLTLRLLMSKAKKSAFLLYDLRSTAAIKVRRELSISPVTNDEQHDQLSAALSQHVNATNNQEELVELMRKLVIALAIEPNPTARSQILNKLLQQAADHRGRAFDVSRPLPKGEPYREQLAEALRIVSKAKLDFRTIIAARKLALPIQVELQESRVTADAARRDKIAADEALERADEECKRLRQQISGLESQVAIQQERLQQNESDIAMERRKAHEIRETLTTRHSNELDGQLRRLTRTLMLEIDEARNCLDREEPNAKMALNRIHDLQSILKPYLENKA